MILFNLILDYMMYSHLDGHRREREPPMMNIVIIKNARQKTTENTDFN